MLIAESYENPCYKKAFSIHWLSNERIKFFILFQFSVGNWEVLWCISPWKLPIYWKSNETFISREIFIELEQSLRKLYLIHCARSSSFGKFKFQKKNEPWKTPFFYIITTWFYKEVEINTNCSSQFIVDNWHLTTSNRGPDYITSIVVRRFSWVLRGSTYDVGQNAFDYPLWIMQFWKRFKRTNDEEAFESLAGRGAFHF